MKRILILIVILMLVFLVGCQQVEPTAEEMSVQQTEVNIEIQEIDAYPDPDPEQEIISEPYIAPEEPTPVPYVFRVSKDDTATVHGILAVTDPEQAMPIPDDGIFLVPLPESDGVMMMPSFEIGKVPQADVDERTGEFVFTDLEPGQYVVMIYTIGNAQMPARNQEGGFAILKIAEEDRNQIIEVNYLLVP